MSEALKNIITQISILESSNKSRSYVCEELVENLVEWGTITHKLRLISTHISQQEFIDNATRLSKLLSILITQIGICDDYTPLPEAILSLKHQKRFDLTESDSITALVYCSHKVIECLAIIASQNLIAVKV
jgi:hypothetical protein